jgi:hypothetical protein
VIHIQPQLTGKERNRAYRVRKQKEDRQLRRRLEVLTEALRPFADEGRKWLGTNPAHDNLRLLCAEDWGLLERPCREAMFTVGDLKRAVAAMLEP